jgi:hypothetical protein
MSQTGPTTMLLLALFGESPDAARETAKQLPDAELRFFTLVIDGWEGDDVAQAKLVEMAEADPLSAGPVVWSASLAARDGDVAARNRFRVWSGLIGGSLGTAIGQDTVITDDPPNRRQVVGPNANFQGLYTYRHLYPWDLLVPGLPKLTLE